MQFLCLRFIKSNWFWVCSILVHSRFKHITNSRSKNQISIMMIMLKTFKLQYGAWIESITVSKVIYVLVLLTISTTLHTTKFGVLFFCRVLKSADNILSVRLGTNPADKLVSPRAKDWMLTKLYKEELEITNVTHSSETISFNINVLIVNLKDCFIFM